MDSSIKDSYFDVSTFITLSVYGWSFDLRDTIRDGLGICFCFVVFFYISNARVVFKFFAACSDIFTCAALMRRYCFSNFPPFCVTACFLELFVVAEALKPTI